MLDRRTALRKDSPGAVPVISDVFVGRERELDRVTTLLLGQAPLITIVGPGGIGKTRLAAEAAYRLGKATGVRIPWIRLARLASGADAATVLDEVARSVIDTDFSGRSAWQALLDTLDRAAGGRARTVLVMDNCEHVHAGAGSVIAELLDALPGLSVLGTSRTPIGWVDEQLVPLSPLTRRQALTLFRQRAELTGTVIDDEQTATATAICTRLDNYPLHIRMAAARLRRQPLTMILRDLDGGVTDRRMHWAGPLLGVDERHQNIYDLIGWSYRLCDAKERLLFERMSVFAAGYDVDPDDTAAVGADLSAIRAVCSGTDGTGGDLSADEIEDVLERLIDQSLVSLHRAPDAARYSLLQSFRVFAKRSLHDRDGAEAQRLAARHRRYYRDAVRTAAAEWFSDREGQLLDWARAAWDNLREAIDSSFAEPGEAVVGMEISTGLIALRAPFFTGTLRESRRWVEQALDATADADPPPALTIGASASLAWLSLCQGRPDEAGQLLERCLDQCLPGARADRHSDPTIDRGLPAPVEFAAGVALLLVHHDVRAITVLGRARAKFRTAGDHGGAAMSELFEALTAAFLGTAEQALATTARHLGNAARAGARWAESWAELARGIAETKHGDPRRALAALREPLRWQVAVGDSWGTVWAVHIHTWAMARIVTTEDIPSRTARATEIARLLGGAAAMCDQVGVDLTHLGPFAPETERAARITRELLEDSVFDAAWQDGFDRHPAVTEVTKLALDAWSPSAVAAPTQRMDSRPSSWDQLSRAEQAVAVLAAAGWTNAAIAARRGSSHRTVDTQVSAVLRKLAIASRADILPFLPADQRTRVHDHRKSHPRGVR
ncbi:putative regulator [Nocardia nova SH22a]|uniref:Putative regulator n=1 Tax=Nocardia nova SH22a TaxID=1415166 RepID=W5TEC4_9NOCA|nr:AAA family ATPase [Nocardia nova]AHH15591.1 putative regulator [Nocardia nova SH22a]